MPRTKMWLVFYAAIGTGILLGAIFYVGFFGEVAHTFLHESGLGLPIAVVLGLLFGFSYYLFFKLLLRAFTWPFLRRAQALVVRPIAPLLPAWKSNELDKLEEILNEALGTLERLDLFSEIAAELVSSLDPQATLDQIVRTAVETLPGDSGLIFLLDEGGDRYAVRASHHLPVPEGRVGEISFRVGEGVPGWVATRGRPLIIADARQDPRVHPLLQEAGVRSLMSAPLTLAGRPLGALNIFNCSQIEAFDENDLRLLAIYADLAAVAINNARLYGAMEQEREKLAGILRDTTDIVVVLDEAGQIILLNPAAERTFQVPAAQAEGQPLQVLGVSDLKAALDSARQAARAVVYEIAVPGGSTLYASVSPVHGVGWVMVMQDITPLKELDRLRGEWVATVSHDLKNPINVVRMALDLIEESGPLNEEQTEVLGKAREGSLRMQALVTDVLDLARMEAGAAIRAAPLELFDLLAVALNEVEPLARQRELRLRTDVPPDLPLVRGDAVLLTRAVVNLLSNAVKYTPSGGQVTLRAHAEAGSVQVEVNDTGPGIPEEALPHLFERFYRVPGSDAHAEGTGLGLSIVKSILERHGGHVWVESTVGQGSTFAFVLPAVEEVLPDSTP